MTTQILAIQRALSAAGFSPGLLDNAWGPVTAAALKKWQFANGLLDTGKPDAMSIAKLLGTTSHPPVLWLEEINRLMGLREGKGKLDNPVILDWADDLDIFYPHDDWPWCGLLMAHAVRTALPDEPLPTNPLGARNWAKLGFGCLPQLGAIGVFWRGSKSGFLGHVGVLVAQSDKAFCVRAGNQSDSVSDAWIAKDRLLNTRWCATAGDAFQIPLPAQPPKALSLNEA